MITPDTKNWTWVLERRCEECGFDASSLDARGVANEVHANAARWHELWTDGAITPGRADPTRCSTLEYACHVRDVYRRYDGRIALMLDQDDPLFQNWDQDASAATERYDAQDPAAVIADLERFADALAARLDGLSGPSWQRVGRRSGGASFTVDTISRYMLHDTIHHVWDVTNHPIGPPG